MCGNSVHIIKNRRSVILNQRDPSQTTVLRTRYAAELSRRFNRVIRSIREAVNRDDVFGLRGQSLLQSPGPRAFNYPRSSTKVSSFIAWLQQQVANDILSVTNIQQVGESVEGAWQNIYIQDSYKRGVARARYQLRQAGYDVPTLEASGGITAVLGTPFHVDRVGLLYTRAFNQLKGITDQMDSQVSAVLAQGLADGDSPALLARKLVQTVSGTGADLGIRDTLGRYIPAKRRATVLARTEVIRAHAQGQLQEFKNWGVEGVNVKAEFRTAGDERVCPLCEGLEGTTYSIEEASNIIPVHPQCRCIWVPKSVNAPASRQSSRWAEETNPDELFTRLKERAGVAASQSATGTAYGRGKANLIGRTIVNDIHGRVPKLGTLTETGAMPTTTLVLESSPYINQYGILATYKPANRTITMGKRALGKLKHNLRIGGGHNVGTDLASAYRHEYGHHVYHSLLTREQLRPWKKWFNTGGKEKIRRQVSQYGATNADEAFAETFSAYTSPLYESGVARKSLPREIEDLFLSVLENIR